MVEHRPAESIEVPLEEDDPHAAVALDSNRLTDLAADRLDTLCPAPVR
jgi:hypothetical protein